MSNGTEQIESRLAAYIDGELPEGDRAEIEKYLAANPAHRQMIEELRGHKSQIAGLPRERAPAEILDHLQSHLERQALLENVEDAAEALRINRWPQWSAIAAMLLLTTGLGVLVYSVLPGGALNREQIVIAPPSVQNLPTAPDLALDEKDDSPAPAVAEGAREGLLARDVTLAEKRGEPSPVTAATDANRGEDFVDKAVAEIEASRAEEARRLAAISAPPAGGSPLALNNGSAIVVATDDPMITQNLLAGYLGQNAYEFHPVRPDIAKSTLSLDERMVLSSTESQNFNVKSQVVPPQAIGAMVQRVNEKAKASADGEQYLVVRNVSPQDAEKLNRVINTQRGLRQQARVYSNAELYPEYQQASVPQQQQENPPNQAAAQQAHPDLKQNYGQQQKLPTPPAREDLELNGAAVPPAAPSPADTDAAHAAAENAGANGVSTTRPVDANVKMDVLIVVRNEPSVALKESTGIGDDDDDAPLPFAGEVERPIVPSPVPTITEEPVPAPATRPATLPAAGSDPAAATQPATLPAAK